MNALALLPVPTHGLVVGAQRKDAFDDCFVLVSRDVADFFALRYYDTLRPDDVDGGFWTLGGGFSTNAGWWRRGLLDAGVPLLFRDAAAWTSRFAGSARRCR